MKHYLLRRGNNDDFEKQYKDKMMVVEMCAITDKHTIVFCFGKDDIKELEFDNSVTNEKADELIQAISKFFEK
jgi:hypothetical protein